MLGLHPGIELFVAEQAQIYRCLVHRFAFFLGSFGNFGGGGFPTFASGGNYSGGVALVGEKGPELINFNRGGYVYNAQESRRILQSGDTYHQISVPVSVAGESSPRLAGRLRTEITELVKRIIYEEARV